MGTFVTGYRIGAFPPASPEYVRPLTNHSSKRTATLQMTISKHCANDVLWLGGWRLGNGP